MMEFTDPLESGALLPTHSATDSGRKITTYGRVKDAENGRDLMAGVHEDVIRILVAQSAVLRQTSLYAYVIREGHIYHSRKAVVIEVTVEA